jgi:hypothetical protein
MFIENTHHNHNSIPRYMPKENIKEANRIMPEEPTATYSHPQEQRALISQNSNLNYNSAPASNTSSKSGNTPSYNSNQNSNNKSFNNIQENPGKKSTGKSTNTNSNNSSYIKTKGSFGKAYTHKTESTYISGGDSPSPLLDCDETLSTNFAALLNNKNDNNCFWVEKFDPEIKPNENFAHHSQRGILQDITEVMMKVETAELTAEEELANFNPDSNACAIDSDTINYLVMREMDYAPDAHYFDKKQNQINWMMRAILLDWMMEVCMEFTLKRETYHYAVNYVDRYLSSVPQIQKWELQLIGVTAMYIASKVEVFSFTILS